MTSDIQFGNLEQSEPQRALRPDQDGHFVVAEIGEIGPDELKIYVDLDVMRDMEAHARDNTRVELGGVMLGRQQIDDDGQPFVIITDSLRARHYEATKGSFKFTHDTWSQITNERRQFRPDLEMVGWYHTHPGWSVFLSGMDLFICNNFFNRPLDVALVIDPCADDRGWFQWTDDARPVTHRTGGFYLVTGRYRERELNHFARIYNKEPITMNDPRYSGDVYGTGAQPVVNLMDNRKPLFEILIVTMLMMQFLVFGAIAWKFLTPADVSQREEPAQVAQLEQELAELKASQLQRTRDQAQNEILQAIVTAQTGEAGLVENFTKTKADNQQLQSSLEAHQALADKLDREKRMLAEALKVKETTVSTLSAQLDETRQKLELSQSRVNTLLDQGTLGSDSESTEAGIQFAWWWLPVVGLATALVGGLLGFTLGRNEAAADSRLEEDDDPEQQAAMAFNPTAEIATGTDRDETGAADLTVRMVDKNFGDAAGES